MTTAERIIARAARLGIEATLWQKHGRLRIYAKTPKYLSVYLELDGTPENVEGAAFKVFCNTAGQHPNWLKSQVAMARKEYIGLFYAYDVEQHAHLGPMPNGYGEDFNQCLAEARAYVAEKEKELEMEENKEENKE
jgi:hypothetical protein